MNISHSGKLILTTPSDREVTGDTGFGSEEIVVVAIEATGRGVEADGEEFAIGVVEEAEGHPGGEFRRGFRKLHQRGVRNLACLFVAER